MKKLFKITGVVFIFLFFCSFALSFVHAEQTTFWSYQEKLLGKLVHPGFTSLAACNHDRDLFIGANPVLGADPCISYTSLLPVPQPTEQPPVIIDPQKETTGGTWYFLEKDTQHQKHTYATASECQKGRTSFVNGDESKADQCISEYKLLAPLGEIKFAPDNVGDYFNMIFKIAIGLCAALAVVMIVIGGVQYMGNESIFGKTEAKSKITSAILGLLIALGSYALLNTINPDLLGKSGVNIQSVSADIGEEDITSVGSGVNVNGTLVKIKTGKAANCTGGLVSIPSSMGSGQICKDLLDKLQILQSSSNIGWRITSSIRGGGTISSCHLSGNAKSGNCADVQITNNPTIGYTKETGSTNPMWGDFCVAVAKINGLNYANEASSIGNCQSIKPYGTYPNTSGPHLHINFIGN